MLSSCPAAFDGGEKYWEAIEYSWSTSKHGCQITKWMSNNKKILSRLESNNHMNIFRYIGKQLTTAGPLQNMDVR